MKYLFKVGKAVLSMVVLLTITISAQNNQDTKTSGFKTQFTIPSQPAKEQAVEKQTDSLIARNKMLIPVAEKKQQDNLVLVKKLTEELAKRPIRYVYRYRVIHDTVPAMSEPTDYDIGNIEIPPCPDTVYLPAPKRHGWVHNIFHKSNN